MVDISRIELQALDKDELERVKLMLDISKIQADIEMTRQSITESQERVKLNADRYQADLEQMRQSVAQSQATVEKMRKENQWFPWLQIMTTFLTGGVVVFLLTKLL